MMARKVSTVRWLLAITALLTLVFTFAATGCSSGPKNPNLILATTTSTRDSGLLDVLIPIFEEKTGYNVQTVAVGTGAALQMGVDGNADVLLVHAPTSEIPLMENGDCISRKLVMHNDFVIVGPSSDPAGINGMTDAAAAFKKIYDTGSLFSAAVMTPAPTRKSSPSGNPPVSIPPARADTRRPARAWALP